MSMATMLARQLGFPSRDFGGGSHPGGGEVPGGGSAAVSGCCSLTRSSLMREA
jgi:hypothetical protein